MKDFIHTVGAKLEAWSQRRRREKARKKIYKRSYAREAAKFFMDHHIIL